MSTSRGPIKKVKEREMSNNPTTLERRSIRPNSSTATPDLRPGASKLTINRPNYPYSFILLFKIILINSYDFSFVRHIDDSDGNAMEITSYTKKCMNIICKRLCKSDFGNDP